MRYVPYPSYQTPMYSGTSYQSSVPTIGSVGGYGYNDPYQQNGYYNQYFNPYYARQQEEAKRKMQLQQQQTQINIWKKLIKCRDNAYGYEYDEQLIEEQMMKSIQDHNRLISSERSANEVHMIVQKCAQQQEQEKQILENIERERQIQNNVSQVNEGSSKSLYQWLHEDGQERYLQSQYAVLTHQKHNVSNIYDSNGYRQLLGVHDSVFNSLNQNVTIDDMEIQVTLPERMRRERDIRRQQFAEALKSGL